MTVFPPDKRRHLPSERGRGRDGAYRRNVNGQAAAIVSAGAAAAGGAGNGNLATTITAVAQAAAARDTATITGNLQQAVEISATDVALATSAR